MTTYIGGHTEVGQYMEETELCFTENKQKAVMTTKWYFTRIPNYRPACTSEAAIEDCGGTTCVSFTVLFSDKQEKAPGAVCLLGTLPNR